MMLFAMFMKALLIPLLGLALSRCSSGSKSSATVTLGASTPVNSGSRCTLRPASPPSCAYPLPFADRKSSPSSSNHSPDWPRTKGVSSNLTRFGVLGVPSGLGCASDDWRFGACGRGEELKGLLGERVLEGLRLGLGDTEAVRLAYFRLLRGWLSDSESEELCSARSFCDSSIMALSVCSEGGERRGEG